MTVAERVKEFFHNEGIHSTTIQVGILVTFTNAVTLWQSKAIFFHSSFSLSLLRLRSQPAASPPPRIVCSPALNQGPLTRLKRNFHGTTLRDSTAVHCSQKGHLLGDLVPKGTIFSFWVPIFSISDYYQRWESTSMNPILSVKMKFKQMACFAEILISRKWFVWISNLHTCFSGPLYSWYRFPIGFFFASHFVIFKYVALGLGLKIYCLLQGCDASKCCPPSIVVAKNGSGQLPFPRWVAVQPDQVDSLLRW